MAVFDVKTVKDIRIVLGGVAPVPWLIPAASKTLLGKHLNEGDAALAAEKAAGGARPLAHNGYKVPLIKGLIKQALRDLIV